MPSKKSGEGPSHKRNFSEPLVGTRSTGSSQEATSLSPREDYNKVVQEVQGCFPVPLHTAGDVWRFPRGLFSIFAFPFLREGKGVHLKSEVWDMMFLVTWFVCKGVSIGGCGVFGLPRSNWFMVFFVFIEDVFDICSL